jgi:hypothetical protein
MKRRVILTVKSRSNFRFGSCVASNAGPHGDA